MKKIMLLLLSLTMLVTALAGCEKTGAPDGFKLISNDTSDFDLYVPSTWTTSLSEGTVSAYCSPTDPTSVSVMPGELEFANSTVDDWWEIHKAELVRVFGTLGELTVTDATLGGVKGKTYTFTATLGANDDAETAETAEAAEAAETTGAQKTKPVVYYFEITAVVKHSRVYMLTFTSTTELRESHTEELETIKEFFVLR